MEDELVRYYEDYLKKREDKNRWKEYWVSLLNTALVFFDKDCYTDEFIQKIRISSSSRCLLTRRQTYSFRFRLITAEGSFLLKCDSNLQRHRWIRMIQLVIQKRPPQPPPNCIPDYDQIHSDEQRTKYTNNKLTRDETDFKDENSEVAGVDFLHSVDESPNVERKTCWTNSLDKRDYRVRFYKDKESPLSLRKLALVRVTREAIYRLSTSSSNKSQLSIVSFGNSEKVKEVIDIGMENFAFTADERDSISNIRMKCTDNI